jgi:formate dehydrogenase maturation protein FdhE
MGQFGWHQEAGQTLRGNDVGSCPLCGPVEVQGTVKGLAETRSGEQNFMCNMCRYEWGI